MWSIENRTPFPAGRNWTRDKYGVHYWLVAIKATFAMSQDGRLSIADEQVSPVLAPVFRGDPATSSLYMDSDLLAAKPGTDVLVDAHAHAPGAQPAEAVPVALRISSLEKRLVVHGPRFYRRGPFGLTTSRAEPFTSCPVHYELAFGGTDNAGADPRKHRIDLRNPVGKGITAEDERLVGRSAHRIEYPNSDPVACGPAGFGPIASSWSPRREMAGTYDCDWEKAKKPLLPDDYDPHHALAAPLDQRPSSFLKGGEIANLINLTTNGVMRFRLPTVRFQLKNHFGTLVRADEAVLATVHILAEEMRLAMVWQSALRVPARQVDQLDKTIISQMWEGPNSP